jgi:hypothetical protein
MNSKSENIKRKEKTSKSCSVKCGFNTVCTVIIFESEKRKYVPNKNTRGGTRHFLVLRTKNWIVIQQPNMLLVF